MALYEDDYWWIEAAVFAGFLVISVLFELALHAIEHHLEHKNRHGLLAFVQGLKTEVLLYGLLSLLLSVVQPHLANFCVPAPGYGSTDAPAESYGRRLLKYASNCKANEKQVLSYKLAYNIHVLIFMIAVSHIFMALLSLTLCLLKLTRWRRWADAPKDAMEPMSERVLRGLGSSRCTHWLRSFISQYTMGVNKAVFLGVRRFFLEQLMTAADMDQLFNFPFYNFLVSSTEHHMAHLVSLDWFVWLFAVIILLLPPSWQKPALYAMTGLSWLILMACGAKMQSSVVHLAARAHYQFVDVGGGSGSKDVEDGVLQHPEPQRVGSKDQSLKHRVKRVQTTKDLFWFSKPRIFIIMYKMAYFQVSFALAYLLYKAILDKDKTAVVLDTNVLEGVTVAIKEVVPFFSGTVALLVLLGIVLLLIAHSAWVVLPLYCLCMTTSKDATKDVKKFMEALKSDEADHEAAPAYLARTLHQSATMQRLATNWETGRELMTALEDATVELMDATPRSGPGVNNV